MWRTRLALVAAVGVAASPPACRAGLGSFQVNISHGAFDNATCYGRRHPDLAYAFCKDECNVQALHRHFHDLRRWSALVFSIFRAGELVGPSGEREY